MEDKEVVEAFNRAFKQMSNADVIVNPYCIFVTKEPFHAIQEHFYFVIGTRIMALPVKRNKKWKKLLDSFRDLFKKTNVDHVEVYKTRNEAKRAVARNRQGYVVEPINNPHRALHNGVELILTEGSRFKTI